MKNRFSRHFGRLRQRGVSLFVVLVMVLLTTLMMLWAARTALFNELVTANDSDYQRALEAAHAMVRDAELDILGRRADGQPCITTAGFSNCRPERVASNIDLPNGKLYFPAHNDKGKADGDMANLQALLGTRTPSCVAGICVSTNVAPEFWTTPAQLNAMQAVGARYGQFTGAVPTNVGNPLLNSTKVTDARAFYWIEPLQYQANSSVSSQQFSPYGGSASTSVIGVVYRITAVAQGVKPSTRAVVQTIFVRRDPAS